MNAHFRWLTRLLNESGVKYWADSGTLLGLVREQRLLSHDKDIDLGMWDSDIPKLLALRPVIREAGFDLTAKSYRGKVFSLKIRPRKTLALRLARLRGEHWRDKWLPVNVHVFRRSGDFAWSPQNFTEDPFKYPLSARAPVESKTLRICLRKPVYKLLKVLRNIVPLHRRAHVWPLKQVATVFTWWIPRHYFEQLHFDEALQVWLPSDAAEYLTLRYGDWRTPNVDWVYFRDDATIRLQTPEQLLGEAVFSGAQNE